MEVKFDEEIASRQAIGPRSKKGLTGWLVGTQFAKNERQAEIILITLSAGLILLAFSLWFFGSRSSPTLSPEEYSELGP